MDLLQQHEIPESSFAHHALMQGRLEELGLSYSSISPVLCQLAAIQETVHPSLSQPVSLIFSSSHDFVKQHYPNLLFHQENLFSNIINHEAAVVKLAGNHCKIKLVDAGFQSNYRQYLNFWLRMEDLMELPGHWEAAKDFSTVASMSTHLVKKAMKEGARLVDKFHQSGTNALVVSDLGSLSWFSNYTLLQALGYPAFEMKIWDDFLGKTFGKQAPDLQRLLRKLNLPLKNNPKTNDPLTIMSLYGGNELAMLTGAIIKAASLRMIVILDGFTALIAAQMAYRFHENCLSYCFASCLGEEGKHLNALSSQAIYEISKENFHQHDGSNGVFCLSLLKHFTAVCN